MGERGRQWLAELPALLARFAERWELRLGEPYEGMSYNYLVRVERAHGANAVLKLGVPGGPIASEADALEAFDGQGCVRLLAADRAAGALLLERLEPGQTLHSVEDDDRATAIAARVMARVRRPVPGNHSFATVEKWAGGFGRLRNEFGGGTGPFPEEMVERAERLYAELSGSAPETCLLHGDLHHGNVLSAGREPWLAVDPQGVVGDPAYETAPFLRNRLAGASDPAGLVRGRVRILAEVLELDPDRIRQWAQAESVLSAWWDYEDHGSGWQQAIELAGVMAAAARARA